MRINCNHFIDKTDLSHLDQNDVGRKTYLKVVDLTFNPGHNEEKLPKPSTAQDMCNFYVTPARHQAYSSFWLYASCLNIVGNGFIWLYF